MDKKVKWVELGEVVKEYYSGTLITKSQIVTEKKGSVPCIRYGEIYTTYEIWCDNPVSRVMLREGHKCRYCENNDLLLTKIGESVTEIAKPLAYMGEGKVAVDSNTFVLKHNQNAKYLSYALSTVNTKRQKTKICNVSPITISIDIKRIFKLKIPLPSLEQQEKIAKWLDTFSSLERQLERHKSQYQYYLNLLMRGGANGGAEGDY